MPPVTRYYGATAGGSGIELDGADEDPRPDEAWSPSASSSVTVNVENRRGDTPAHSTTSIGSLNVPIGTSTSSASFSQAW